MSSILDTRADHTYRSSTDDALRAGRAGAAAAAVTNRLRELRAARQWSQAELAQTLGVSRQTINAIETGKYDPSLPLAFKIARLFARRIEDIFEDA
jgi:putative transcriptional regulator